MKFYAGLTDQNWFDFLKAQSDIDEVNFWQPSGTSEFRSLKKGDLFLFKLHRGPRTQRRDLIAGGGIFVSFSILPISWAWETFEKKNGADSYLEMRRRLLHYRRIPDRLHEDFKVGCIILAQPFFLDDSLWFSAPDWSSSIVRGKATGYELDKEAGKFIWDNLQRVWEQKRLVDMGNEALRIEEERSRYGKETIIRPRLGQGAFRVLVTEAYRRSCAITSEHSLPVLEASHIKPYNENGAHATNNGILLRSDLHRLFDSGYMTITPEYRIRVSNRLKEDYLNGRTYYPFQNQALRNLPEYSSDYPLKEMLVWHNEKIFKE